MTAIGGDGTTWHGEAAGYVFPVWVGSSGTTVAAMYPQGSESSAINSALQTDTGTILLAPGLL